MRFVTKIATVFLLSFILIFSFVAASSSDIETNLENDIKTDFLTDYIEEDGPIYLVLFFSITSDDGFFMLDDIVNSGLSEDDDVEIIAVDISSAQQEAYEAFTSLYENENVTFTQVDKDLAKKFADKTEISENLITYPLSVIIDQQFKIRYVLNGYRAPDTVLSYVEDIKNENETAKPLWTVSRTDNGVGLRWRSSPDVNSFTLYRSSSPDENFTPIFTTYDNSISSYLDEDVSAGDKYYYKIGITKIRDDYTTYYDETENLEVKVELSTPSNVSFLREDCGKAVISWDFDEDISSYFIYKSLTPFGNFVLLTELPGDAVSYTDINSASGSYYKIKAFDGRHFSNTAYINSFTQIHITDK